MIRIENSILINANLQEVFEVAIDFEKYPQFIPTYKEVNILERQDNKMIIERVGLAKGKPVRWKSQVILEKYHSIKAQQLEGPLKGMMVYWSFEGVMGGTNIILIHEFEYKMPLIGNLIGKWFIAGIVKRMAQETLEGIKNRVQGGNG
ncbi:MAG: SRPBCC family protein [Candidatus Desantisbacteria bacterium]